MLRDAAKSNKVFLIGGSFPESDEHEAQGQAQGRRLYNTCLIFNDQGELVGKHRKIHLFDIDIPGKQRFKESETLSPGNALTIVPSPYGPIAVAICYDLRFAELALLAASRGCKMLVYPGAFNTTTGPLHWELLLRARAVDTQCFVAGVSPARNAESTYQAWGHTSIVSPWGNLLATTDENPDIVYADVG
jgi:omega-amidase